MNEFNYLFSRICVTWLVADCYSEVKIGKFEMIDLKELSKICSAIF